MNISFTKLSLKEFSYTNDLKGILDTPNFFQ